MGLTPSGNVSLKPRQGRSFKRARRIEIVARLEAQFIKDSDIAAHLGITVAAVQAIKKSDECIAKRVALQTGLLSVYDQARLSSEEAQKDELALLLPNALNAVKNILADPKHPQYAKVALDLMDRNTATSKISRTQHQVNVNHNTSEQDARAKELFDLLGPDTAPELPKPDSKAPNYVPVPMIEDGIDPEDVVPEEELDEAIEENLDVNDLIN